MANNNQNIPANLNYNCSFKFTFEFGKTEPSKIGTKLYKAILRNQQKAVNNGYIKPVVLKQKPYSLPLSSNMWNNNIANLYKETKVTINPNGNVEFEYVEYSDQNIFLPDTDYITLVFAMILKSYLDILNLDKNLQAKLTFVFSSDMNTNTYYNVYNSNIWKNKFLSYLNTKITNGDTFLINSLDWNTDPIDILELFFRLYKYPQNGLQLNVDIDRPAAKAAWKRIFIHNGMPRPVFKSYKPFFRRKP